VTPEEWARVVHFTPAEFDSHDAPGSGAGGMQWPFLSRLDALRSSLGRPILIESGFRTPLHNEAVGGVQNSAHLRGLASDVWMGEMKLGSPTDTLALLVAAVRIGFRRIGVDLEWRFLHLDVDSSLPTPALWFYHQPPKPTA
jgi:zinc D-Ala-D-Ala carboxypeptidase